MKFAANYSRVLAQLVRNQTVQLDEFKCPAWPEIVAEASELRPSYAHLPLVTDPNGIRDGEKKQLVDWSRIDHMLAMSDTTFVNVHLQASTTDYPDIPIENTSQEHIDRITEDFTKSIELLTQRYGNERVICENLPDSAGSNLHISLLPEVIKSIIESTNTGLLLDLSHAELAAFELGIDSKNYTLALPTNRIREIHLTGIDVVQESWVEQLEAAGFKTHPYRHFIGRKTDHLPLQEDDWQFVSWAMEQIHSGSWNTPEVVSLEYGGVGGIWEYIGDEQVMIEQIPRLYQLVHNHRATNQASE